MKKLSSIKDLLHNWPDFKSSIAQITENASKKNGDMFPIEVNGIHGCFSAFFLNELKENIYFKNLQTLQYNNTSRYTEKQSQLISPDFVFVVPTDFEANNLYSDISAINPDAEIYVFPSWGTIPYRPTAKGSVVFGKRAAFLSKLCQDKNANEYININAGQKKEVHNKIFIMPQRAFISKFPNPDYIKSLSFSLEKGDSIDTTSIAQKLSQMGYLRVSRVNVRGEFSLRGEVLDIFLPLDEYPTRVIFDFDEIEAFKEFEVDTQTTVPTTKTQITVSPMKEIIWNETFVDLLSKKLDLYQKEAVSQEDDSIKPESENAFSSDSLKKIHLPFTEKAWKNKDQMLLELMEKGECEGEEFFYHLLWDKDYSILDYISSETLLFYFDYDRLSNAELSISREYLGMYRKAREEQLVFPPEQILYNFKELSEKHLKCIFFRTLNRQNTPSEYETNSDLTDFSDSISVSQDYKSPTDDSDALTQKMQIKFNSEPARSFFGNINFMKEELDKLQADDWNVYIFTDNENQLIRIQEIFKNYTNPENEDILPLQLLPQAISAGFSIPEIKLLIIQENEIFGRRKYVPKSLSKAKSKPIDTFVELNPGDYVVHVNWGIGQFLGIERVKSLGNERDFIKLQYAENDYALVPIEQVNLVQRYIGSEGEKPKLDKIGSKSWETRKNKVQKEVEDLAQKLIDLYSRRKASVGFAFPKETEWQAAFEAAFPYEDTPDQITVTDEVKKDMERAVPMDRLVCGDVGYGKTEIAMRSAFKAVMGGKQVAFLAPTTILAEQHYDSCKERFKNFPVKIERLSRFVSTAEQKKILAKLAEGQVDILVGTHRIIQKDVVFKNLGLMIIDEEQRFGVKDKEKLKVIKNNIDCLTMSATPIPRTLHMSLLKIRDMSLLTTPPQSRQPIETVIDEYSDDRIITAIRREIERGGQIFYLHNRVESLLEVRRKIEQLVPEVLVDVAHGKMSSSELDDIFHRFKMGGFHVLIATTIIENGIDIPNVNTIIIDRADMYGVSQLYQLRGRVGRGDRQAYAYLLYPENKSLSEIAMKRLQVISDFTELGSGFKIAMKDMEIRGAGNLLGKDQSGNVYAVGFELYVKLLNDAVNRLISQKDYKAQTEIILELEYSGFIPDTYVTNPQIKMEIYKKIASITTEPELEAVVSELSDRFGPIPEEVSSLLALAEIRIISKKLNISTVKERQGEVKVTFSPNATININQIMKLIKDNPGTIRINPAGEYAIYIKLGKIGLKEKSEFIREKLSQLL
ncbi:MAG: transcription-repair coupling factor [Treponema sp.]|nr:transcription-repair coupling factor [Treponema sp.]